MVSEPESMVSNPESMVTEPESMVLESALSPFFGLGLDNIFVLL